MTLQADASRGSRADAWAFVFLAATVLSAPIGNNIRVLGHPSIFPFRVFLVAFLAAAAVRYFMLGCPRPSLSLRDVGAPWVGITAWGLLSLVWAQDLGAGIRYVGFLFQGTVLILGLRVYGRRRDRLAILLSVAAIGLVVAIACALFERATLYRFPASHMRDPLVAWQHYYLFTGLFHNPNDFATYLALWLPLVLQAYLEWPKLSVRAAALGLCGLCGFLLITMFSRANTIAAVLAGLVIFAFSARRRWRQWAILLAAMPVLFFALPGRQKEFFVRSLGRVSQGLTAKAAQDDPRARLARESLALLERSHGLGVGAGNVEPRMAALHAQRAYAGTRLVNLHNWWLEILVGLGVAGFALYLMFYLRLLRGLLTGYCQLRSADAGLAALCLGLFAAFAGLTIGCLSSSSLVFQSPMWVFFGLGAAAVGAAEERGRPRPPEAGEEAL